MRGGMHEETKHTSEEETIYYFEQKQTQEKNAHECDMLMKKRKNRGKTKTLKSITQTTHLINQA